MMLSDVNIKRYEKITIWTPKVRRTIRLTGFVSALYKNCDTSPRQCASGSLYVVMVGGMGMTIRAVHYYTDLNEPL